MEQRHCAVWGQIAMHKKRVCAKGEQMRCVMSALLLAGHVDSGDITSSWLDRGVACVAPKAICRLLEHTHFNDQLHCAWVAVSEECQLSVIAASIRSLHLS